LAGQQKGITTIGADLSPLAVLASSVKSRPLDEDHVRAAWQSIRPRIRARRRLDKAAAYDPVIHEAFDSPTLATLHAAKTAILEASDQAGVRDFVYLALLRVLPRFSRLVQKGGWLTRATAPLPPESLYGELSAQLRLMLGDLAGAQTERSSAYVVQSDARALPIQGESLSAIVTSPPYANRHDYTRVFSIELLFGLLDWDQTRALRYQSVHSHPEAHPRRPDAKDYLPPRSLPGLVTKIRKRITDSSAKTRIPRMLDGYFLDLHLCLLEIRRTLKTGGYAAIVIGNVQYCGVQLKVDAFLSELAAGIGLEAKEIRVARRRGNSAQQMKEFGRTPSRESVVILKKPSSSSKRSG
jgi:hypothetical protein